MFDHIDPISYLSMLVPLLPLAATLAVALFGKRWLKEQSHWPIIVSFVAAFLVSARLLTLVVHETHSDQGKGISETVSVWNWVDVKDAISMQDADNKFTEHAFNIPVKLRADPLTCAMLCMVTFIASLIAVYATGYMKGDPGYWRFFTYIGLFVFSMTMLVSVSNFLLLYVFWEAVGVCSYLLIGFWFQKPEAAAAGKKAFLVNRIGDFGFALGVFLIWCTYGTLDYDAVFSSKIVDGHVGDAIALLLFVGACGKSAQFPLHVWLPDAMEGPTPVSALIHAATMVTAGVYMVTRCTPLYAVSDIALCVVACTGAFTALLAALTALTQTDLKRVMAYSTVSQLGYMFLALGCGSLTGITAAMFHLFTHAFFKALLFLGAGSVMHAMHHVIDMRRFSGLRHIMPWTHATFWVGCLALAGVVPFAGFWSKDMILGAAHDKMHGDGPYHQIYAILYYTGVFVAFLTAFYTFRALFLTFFGPLKTPAEAHHPHESPRSMTIPLVVLAVFAFSAGWIGEFWHVYTFLWHTPSLATGAVGAQAQALLAEHKGLEMHFDVAAMSTVVALAGVGLAAFMYLGKRTEAEQLAEITRTRKGLWLYNLSLHKFYIDEIYSAFVVWPLRGLAWLAYFVDRYVIDATVNLFGWIPQLFGALFRSLQTGMVQFYALAMVLGMLVLFGSLRLTAFIGN